ncbi:Envelope glycoprotein gp160 [Ancistrocladus abbreviatus]
MAVFRLLPLLLLLSLSAISAINGHNITEILASDTDFTQFNSYLTQTKLADEINSRQTITVLALSNAAMSALTAKHPLSVIKNLLSLHVLLDYYDPQKLHSISKGTTLTTTLYQTTGNAPGNLGFVNITDLKGGVVGFGSAAPGSKLDSTYVKSVKQIPYNISVLEINAPITAPGIMTAPAPSASDVNVTALLDKAGCKTFASLIMSSGVLKVFQAQMDKGGLTVFAPTDEAFAAKGVPDLSKLSNAELVSLLQYHALNSYAPKGTLKNTKDRISTIATSGAGKYDITATSSGDDVILHTGVDSSRISSVLLDSTPVVIFTVDNVLLPEELFGKSPSPAPAPAPALESPSSSPAPAVLAPSPAPASEAPTPILSPPAPPTESPGGAPAEAPGVKSENSSSDHSAATEVSAPASLKAVTLVSCVIALVFLS